MASRTLIPLIERQIAPSEDPVAVAAMIEVFASLRADERQTSRDDERSSAAKILCIIFDPLKPPGYARAVTSLRRTIARTTDQEALARRLREALPRRFFRDSPAALFRSVATTLATRRERAIQESVAAVGEAFNADEDRLKRLFIATARVLELRLHVPKRAAERVMFASFSSAVRERSRVVNPYPWIMNFAIENAQRWSSTIADSVAARLLDDEPQLRDEEDEGELPSDYELQ